jgi:tRNA(Ile)-lysidine synthase TilS/MesJ
LVRQDDQAVKICTRCVLPETFPGISFDEAGVCSYCARSAGSENRGELNERFNAKFIDILERLRGTRPYDAIMAYSGGKDSTYTLKFLKERYHLRVLAVTLDHGFVSPTALKNIRTVTDRLDIDHYLFRPGVKTLCRLFRRSMEVDVYPIKALERASAICNSCMNLVKSLLIKMALEMQVPMIIYGWSPGQAPLRSSVFKTNEAMLKTMQKAVSGFFERLVGESLQWLLLEDRHFENAAVQAGESFPYIIHPLAFQGYSEETIIKTVSELGWIQPEDTGANSSNCLLNDFAIDIHCRRHKFHPYAFEIAGLVRDGFMSRAEAIERLSTPTDSAVVGYVKKKLEAEADVD